MREHQENKLRMYYSVSAVCDNRPDLWCENEAFLETYSKFRSKIPQIKRCKDILTVETIVSQSFKSVDRIELEEVSFFLAGRILLYAKQKADEGLYAEIRNFKNCLSHCTDMEFIRVCTTLSEVAENCIQELSAFAVTPEEITELKQLAADFAINQARSKSHHAKNKSTEEQLKKLFKDTDDILKRQLDHVVDFFKNSESEFYEAYLAARVIVEVETDIYKELSQMSTVWN